MISTFEELARRQGLSSARVRQIYRAALIRLRQRRTIAGRES